MSGWKAKRFWKEAKAEECDGGFTVRLDGRPVKTPKKTLLVVPTLTLAQTIAAEWDAQEGTVRPETMPFTRASNSALDKVGPLRDAVIDEIAGFGGADLLCYRAEGPAELVARQAEAWDPLLDWARDTLGAALTVTAGIVHVGQAETSLARLKAILAEQSDFQLMALHDLVAISGSLILGLAVAQGKIDAETAFRISRIDETWQSEQWGVDADAAAAEEKRLLAFLDASRFYALCG